MTSVSTRPRVLHIYKDYYPPVMGGIELTINLLAQGCKNFDVTVLVNSGTNQNSEEMIDGIRVVKVAEWKRVASAPISPGFASALKREAANADLLHFHHPNPTGDLARFIARSRVPAVMTYHSDVVRQKYAMIAYGRLQRWMMGQMKVIMPTSPNYMESSPWLQEFRDRCQVVPLGIRLDEFAATPGTQQRAAELRGSIPGPIVLFVGRLRYYKGLQYLVSAMASAQAHLVIIGTGAIQSELESQARQLGIADRVHFTGELLDAEKIAWLHAVDVFCMPSHLRSEAFGLSQVEAMASGLPVVSTRIASGVPFVNEDGTSGLTVPPEDPAALAQAINTLLADPALRETLSAGARHRAHSLFSAEVMSRNVETVYRQVLHTTA